MSMWQLNTVTIILAVSSCTVVSVSSGSADQLRILNSKYFTGKSSEDVPDIIFLSMPKLPQLDNTFIGRGRGRGRAINWFGPGNQWASETSRFSGENTANLDPEAARKGKNDFHSNSKTKWVGSMKGLRRNNVRFSNNYEFKVPNKFNLGYGGYFPINANIYFTTPELNGSWEDIGAPS